MRNFYGFLSVFIITLIVGFGMGYVWADAPRQEKVMKLQNELKQAQQAEKEYRDKCIAWSHYAWKLEHFE